MPLANQDPTIFTWGTPYRSTTFDVALRRRGRCRPSTSDSAGASKPVHELDVAVLLRLQDATSHLPVAGSRTREGTV